MLAKILLLFPALLLLQACALTPEVVQSLNPDTLYRRDMIVTVNDQTFEGVAVVDMRDVNDFHIVARGDLNLFTMTTCHRETSKESAWNVTETVHGPFGWGSKKVDKPREATFQYQPVKGIEDGVACPVELGGYDKAGRHSWGFVDFKTEDFKLPGTIGCNGTSHQFEGVDACQAKTGLFQVVEFPVPVIVSPDKGCDLGQPKGLRFEFPIPRGMCVYIFKEAGGERLARITTIGYDSILIRE